MKQDKMLHVGPSENDTDREWFVHISYIFKRWLDKIMNENNSMKESVMKEILLVFLLVTLFSIRE